MADGITNVVYNVTRGLAKKGHEVTVYTSDMLDLHGNHSCQSTPCKFGGVNVYYLRSILRQKTVIVTPSILRLFLKKMGDFDIVHIHDARSFQGISASFFSQLKDIPYIFQPHGSYLTSIDGSSHNSLGKKIAKTSLDNLVSDRVFKKASKVIALTETEALAYRQAGVAADKVIVIPNGLSSAEYHNLPLKGIFKAKFNIETQSRIVLYVGRIHKTKGIDLLINAFFLLKKKLSGTNVQLVIAGPDDGYLAEAKTLVISLGLSDSVLFTGFLDKEDKLAALVDADVFVTPSFSGFPVTFLEACSVGTPIVTTTLGDSMPWIDNDVGFVTKPTADDLADAAYSILSSDKLKDKLSKNCAAIMQSTFSINRIVDQIEQVYLGAL